MWGLWWDTYVFCLGPQSCQWEFCVHAFISKAVRNSNESLAIWIMEYLSYMHFI